MTFWTTHLGAHSWGRALLLKSAMLGFGICVVIWAGWPHPRQAALDYSESTPVGPQSVARPALVPLLMAGASAPVPEIFESTAKPNNGETFSTDQLTQLVDLNGSSRTELAALPGIGLVLAGRIVAYRSTHGMFQQVDELVNVSGVGPKRFRRLEPLLTVEGVVGKNGS